MTENKNPFLKPYNTPHDTAPFHLIKIEHYEPALLEGMKEQNEEIDAIVNNPEAPTFQNTIVALEKIRCVARPRNYCFRQFDECRDQ